ncbi:MAG TPA: PEGA domain-containing protein [Thermoanaerobaculia bacterium]|nr:PEGA domain-containing protein [Thermoanaerobaculia bacterium]
MSIPKRVVRVTTVITLLLVLVACVSFAGDKTPLPQNPRVLVTVTFDSRPDLGEVYVNGDFVGTAPMAQHLPPGVHTIEIKRDGFSSWRRDLTVKEHNPTRVVALLKQTP